MTSIAQNKNIEIIPTILTKTYTDFRDRIDVIAPHFEKAHIDLIDPEFVDNKTYSEIRKIDSMRNNLEFDVHIMSYHPEKYLPALFKVKKIKRIFLHYEITPNIDRMIKEVKEGNRKVGLTTNIGTPVSIYNDYLDKIDAAHLMSVHPGYNGSDFLPEVLPKIKRLRDMSPTIEICVDGGIKNHNIKDLAEAGANTFFIGSFISNNDPEGQKKKLTSILNI